MKALSRTGVEGQWTGYEGEPTIYATRTKASLYLRQSRVGRGHFGRLNRCWHVRLFCRGCGWGIVVTAGSRACREDPVEDEPMPR